MQHSKVVGGSTAKRVINCPGSVALVQRMPPQPSSKYAEEGTMLHECMEKVLTDTPLEELTHLTPEQVEKIDYCLTVLDQIDPRQKMTYCQEVEVEFEGVKGLEGVFGNVDLIGRLDDTTYIIDWKFGDGVMVEAEENPQLLFYAAAALKTAKTQWAFEGAEEIELIIVQPPAVRRWTTTFKRLHDFTLELQAAVKLASKPDAPMALGDWCRWCTAKPICPLMTGAVDRVVHTKLEALPAADLAAALTLADKLEAFIGDARRIAQERLEKNLPVPGYKLVAKRATRQWADEKAMHLLWLNAGIATNVYQEVKLRSPAQMEKVCKEHGVPFPTDQVVSVSSGNTLASESDPRPAVMVLGEQLKAALNRLK